MCVHLRIDRKKNNHLLLKKINQNLETLLFHPHAQTTHNTRLKKSNSVISNDQARTPSQVFDFAQYQHITNGCSTKIRYTIIISMVREENTVNAEISVPRHDFCNNIIVMNLQTYRLKYIMFNTINALYLTRIADRIELQCQ